jgi:hypothetical protein
MSHAGLFAGCILLSTLGSTVEPSGDALAPGNFFGLPAFVWVTGAG